MESSCLTYILPWLWHLLQVGGRRGARDHGCREEVASGAFGGELVEELEVVVQPMPWNGVAVGATERI